VKSELTMRLNANGDGYFLIDKDKLEENTDRKKRLSEIIINQSIKIFYFIFLILFRLYC